MDQAVPDPTNTPALPQKTARSRWRRRVTRLVIAVVIFLVATELITRFYLGFTDPPLMMADPQMEYLYQPNQTCRMWRHLIHYNAYSMRSDDFPPHKASPDELRVMFIGDSVINGGNQTDQSELATSVLQRELHADRKRPVTVGNMSTGGWGPINELAYLHRYLPTCGLFDADIVVIVLNSYDAIEVPTFVPMVDVSREMPSHKPISGAWQLWKRYAWPFMKWKWSQARASGFTVGDPVPATDEPLNAENVARNVAAVQEMIRIAHEHGAVVIVAQHLTPSEQPPNHLLPGHDILLDAARSGGAEQIVQFGPAFARSMAQGHDPYRDTIHPNATGQRVMADVLKPMLQELGLPPTTRPTGS